MKIPISILLLITNVLSFLHHEIFTAKKFDMEQQLADCFSEISRIYFPPDLPLAIQTPSIVQCDSQQADHLDYVDVLLQKLHTDRNNQIVVFGCRQDIEFQNSTKDINVGAVIVLIPELDWKSQLEWLVDNMLRILYNFESFSYRVVIVSAKSANTKRLLKEIARQIVQVTVRLSRKPDIIILSRFQGRHGKEISNIYVITWFPEDQEDPCFKTIDNVTIMDRWVSQKKIFLNNSSLFQAKKITHKLRCMVDVEVIMTFPFICLAEIMNEYEPFIQIEGPFYEIFKAVSETTHLDFAFFNESKENDFGTVVPSTIYSSQSSKCHRTYPHFSIDVTWYVPVHRTQRWQGIIRAFNPTIWLFVTMTYILGSLTFWILHKYYRQHVTVIDILLNCYGTYLAISVPYNLSGKLPALFFTLWLLYCILIYTAYTSELTGFFASPGMYQPIKYLEDLEVFEYEKWNTIVFEETFTDMHGSELEEPFEYIDEEEESWKHLPQCDIFECFDKMMDDRNVAVLGITSTFDTYIQYQYNEKGKRLIDPMTNYLKHNYLTIFGDCLYTQYFDTITHRLISSGILDHSKESVLMQAAKEIIDEKDLNYERVTNLTELQAPFFVLIVGNLIGFIVFICEIFSFLCVNIIYSSVSKRL